ncbi:13356_t:CDS:2, partial [Funneliformis geosporum]
GCFKRHHMSDMSINHVHVFFLHVTNQWEVYRAYEYETTDNLGNLFRVEVEEALVIHKQHAKLYDLEVAEGLSKTNNRIYLDVKQYQRVHVLQYATTGMIISEYEEERLAEYQYQLELDVFNQWEYYSERENQQSTELALG